MGLFSKKKKNNVVVKDIKVTRPNDDGTPPPSIKPMVTSATLPPKPQSIEKEAIRGTKSADSTQSKRKMGEGSKSTGRTQYSTETRKMIDSDGGVESRSPEADESEGGKLNAQSKEERQNVSGEDGGSDLDDENYKSNDDDSYVSGDETATLSVLKILEGESAQESTTTPSVQGNNQTTANHMYEEADKL